MRLSCTHASNEAAFNDEAGLELLGLPTAALFVVQTVSVWPRLVHRLHARLRWCAKPRRHMGGAEPALPDGDYEKPEGQDLSQYSRMMAAIHSSHRTGNDIRFALRRRNRAVLLPDHGPGARPRAAGAPAGAGRALRADRTSA
jgi:hypothetical protein